jgi:hypothetical protein
MNNLIKYIKIVFHVLINTLETVRATPPKHSSPVLHLDPYVSIGSKCE